MVTRPKLLGALICETMLHCGKGNGAQLATSCLVLSLNWTPPNDLSWRIQRRQRIFYLRLCVYYYVASEDGLFSQSLCDRRLLCRSDCLVNCGKASFQTEIQWKKRTAVRLVGRLTGRAHWLASKPVCARQSSIYKGGINQAVPCVRQGTYLRYHHGGSGACLPASG